MVQKVWNPFGDNVFTMEDKTRKQAYADLASYVRFQSEGDWVICAACADDLENFLGLRDP